MSKQQVFYIHGGNAYSDYDTFLQHLQTKTIRDLPWTEERKKWSATLVERLGDSYEVFKPTMPNQVNAKYIEWKIWFERHFEYLRDDVILIGWSQGGYFLSKYLIENDTPFTIKALFWSRHHLNQRILGVRMVVTLLLTSVGWQNWQ